MFFPARVFLPLKPSDIIAIKQGAFVLIMNQIGIIAPRIHVMVFAPFACVFSHIVDRIIIQSSHVILNIDK
jgi:hypothetical protein